MKLRIYTFGIEEVFQHCLDSLKESGYLVERTSSDKSMISSMRENEIPLFFSLIDLKIIKDKYAITVTIISNNLSKLFGNFYYDREGEEAFTTSLLRRLQYGARKKNSRKPDPESSLKIFFRKVSNDNSVVAIR